MYILQKQIVKNIPLCLPPISWTPRTVDFGVYGPWRRVHGKCERTGGGPILVHVWFPPVNNTRLVTSGATHQEQRRSSIASCWGYEAHPETRLCIAHQKRGLHSSQNQRRSCRSSPELLQAAALDETLPGDQNSKKVPLPCLAQPLSNTWNQPTVGGGDRSFAGGKNWASAKSKKLFSFFHSNVRSSTRASQSSSSATPRQLLDRET